jgi:hypothetical protein
MENGPSPLINLNEVQLAIQKYFETIVDQKPGEVGTCKKMVRLDCLSPEWAHLCVVYAKESNDKLNDIVRKEYQLITHLSQHDYPIAASFHPPFVVHPSKQRVAMILPFIPGVFIEAKTPNPLKLLITAGLLGLTARSQEGWLAFNREKLITQIKAQLALPEALDAFKLRAKCLANEFKALIEKLGIHSQKIYDLQMIISPSGKLKVIDPLEVINVSMNGRWFSLLEQDLLDKPDQTKFVHATHRWLLTAQQFCSDLSQFEHITQISEQCSKIASEPLLFRSNADNEGKSRLHQIKNGAPSTPPSSNGFKKPPM